MEHGRKSLSRRGFLLGVGGSALLSACGGGGGGTSSASSSGGTTAPGGTAATSPVGMRAPVKIDLSQANLPPGASTVGYAYIIGGLYTNAGLTTFECYRLDASGTLHAISTSDNTQAANTFPDPNGVVSATDRLTINATYPSSWADYSITLSTTAPNYIDLGNINTANIPGLGTGNNAFSMRVYISLGIPKLPFTAQAAYTAGGVDHVNPYAGPGFDSGSPGALCLFDWFECSIDSGGVLNGNPTYVDQFGMPLVVVAQPGTTTQGQLNITRQQVLTNIAGFSPASVYAGLTQAATASSAYPSGTNYLRAISPDHLAGLSGTPGAGASFGTYFDTTISAWDGLGTDISVTDTNSGTYVSSSFTSTSVGGVVTGTWTFTKSGSPNLVFNDITSSNIWQCAGSMASGGTAQQNIGKQLLAAFNRGQMNTPGPLSLSDSSCPNPTTAYYQSTPYNMWAKRFHNWSSNGLAYGFAYDDVCSQNPSFNTTGAMTSLSITLGTMF